MFVIFNKAIFLDRDGVINKKAPDKGYITSWDNFQFLPGVLKALAKISQSSYKIFIVTNQRGISRGIMSEDALKNIHNNMITEIRNNGGRIDEIYYCPHGNNECTCRKPLPGMLDNAKSDYNISLEESWVVGDSITDIKAGKARECKTIYIGEDSEAMAFSDYSVDSLDSAVNLISSINLSLSSSTERFIKKRRLIIKC